MSLPRIITRFLQVTIITAIAAMAHQANAQTADNTNTDASSTATVHRIVSLNGSNTELLFAFGVGDQVVGRDDSAAYPADVFKIPSVGYQFKLSAEGILSLKPTLVIGRTDVKPPQVVDQLRATGVRVELLDEPNDFDSARERIVKLGKILNREARATELVTQLDADLKIFNARKAELGDATKKKAVFLYLRGPQVTFVMGTNTGPGNMIELVGADHAIPSVKDTAPVTAESLVAAQPDVIVVFTHGLESLGGVDGLLKMHGVAQTPAGRNRRVITMADDYLGGFTNRVGKAALDLMNAMQAEGVVSVQGR